MSDAASEIARLRAALAAEAARAQAAEAELAQARALGLTEFAADVLDLCLDSLDGFKETVLDK